MRHLSQILYQIAAIRCAPEREEKLLWRGDHWQFLDHIAKQYLLSLEPGDIEQQLVGVGNGLNDNAAALHAFHA